MAPLPRGPAKHRLFAQASMSILQVSEIPLPPSTTPSPSGYNSVDEVWFQDGTLIIEAEGSLFRVYGGLLGAESPVFHDMLEFPQPEGAESIDGCPVVHLSDSAPDVNCFLKALFDYKCVRSVLNNSQCN